MWISRLRTMNWSEAALSLLYKLDNFNSSSLKATCIPLVVRETDVGILAPSVVSHLKKFSDIFNVVQEDGKPVRVEVVATLSGYEMISNAFHKVVSQLTKEDAFETLRYWRHEDYEVSSKAHLPSLFKLERAAVTVFGVRSYGAHMNGYVHHPDKGMCLWLGRRSMSKQTYPGMLDNLAAGGISVGLGIRETMIKECYEEATIPEEIAKNMISVGCISYIHQNSRGIGMEMQYCFDLELPLDFIPRPLDGEVDEFIFCDIEEVKQLIIQDTFKPNCAVITLHFLIRHGFVTPDNEPRYSEIVQKMNNWS